MIKYCVYYFPRYFRYQNRLKVLCALPQIVRSQYTWNRQPVLKLNIPNSSRFLKTALSFSILGLLGGKEKLDPESEMIMTMKRAILCTQRGQYSKAEQLLHIALGMAQKQNNQLGITYIYDLMANLAMERDEPVKAKTMFVNVLQRLFNSGVKEDDIKVIHISLKLARIHMQMNLPEDATIGFQWCFEKLRSLDLRRDKDALLLYGITCDYYAQLLLSTKQFKAAISNLKEAYDICVKLEGPVTDQSVRLLNDLGAAHWRAGELNAAEKHLRTALVQSMDLPEKAHLGVIRSNLGMVLLQRGNLQEAGVHCKEAWHISKNNKDTEAMEQANTCLDQILKMEKKVKNK